MQALWQYRVLQADTSLAAMLLVQGQMITMPDQKNFPGMLSREQILDRYQRSTALIAKAKQFLDETMLPEISLDKKIEKVKKMPDSINDGALLGMLAVVIDNLHQSAPTEQQFQNAVIKICESIRSDEFIKILGTIIKRK